MLTCKNLSVKVKEHTIINNVHLSFQAGQMHALVGPSGSGKSTLIKGILRLNNSSGHVIYYEDSISDSHQLAGRIGFVPQFSIAHNQLSVRQSLNYSLSMFGQNTKPKEFFELVDLIGLTPHLDKQVSQLSGGQTRRLSLALELVSNPSYLICDEVTTGLDPQSEEEVLEVLSKLTKKGITIICIIHNLHQLYLFNKIHVINKGSIVFQGSYDSLLEHFETQNPCKIYSNIDNVTPLLEENNTNSQPQQHPHVKSKFSTQFFTLLKRRITLFYQDTGHLVLTLLLTFGFPFLVVIFALNGLPQLESLSLHANGNILDSLIQEAHISKQTLQIGSLVSGIIMFQVILLTLMGANNGAREIAAERNIFEKEKLSGLDPIAYILSKISFMFLLSLLQGTWMAFFVKYVCSIPGSLILQSTILTFTVFSMSCVSLAISSLAKNSEKASLIATYLVGFQLPLSGVVLALPEYLIWVFRPFIASYWGWSGYLNTLINTRFYDSVVFTVEQTTFAVIPCLLVLTVHIIIGLTVCVFGAYKQYFK